MNSSIDLQVLLLDAAAAVTTHAGISLRRLLPIAQSDTGQIGAPGLLASRRAELCRRRISVESAILASAGRRRRPPRFRSQDAAPCSNSSTRRLHASQSSSPRLERADPVETRTSLPRRLNRLDQNAAKNPGRT